jgi:FlaA1/EpsC-like NDP-sugar epimerase
LLSLDVKKIIIFSRHENIQVSMERKFVDERLVFVLGDVRNKELLLKVTT